MNNKMAALSLLVMGMSMTACGEKSTKEQTAMADSTKQAATTGTKETLPSGLAFIVLKAAAADAKSPSKGKKVSVHYTGWLDEKGELGSKFDSSVDRGFPFKFVVGVGQVIDGWDEGVMLMKVGEKRRFFIPANLGYGEYGAGNVIPPNAALIFDVEVLGVE